MKKASFTGPSLVLLLFGLFSTYCAFFPLVEFKVYRMKGGDLIYFAGILIIFAESFVYWRIRRKNAQRGASWMHVLLFLLGTLMPYLREEVFIFYDNFTPTPDIAGFVRTVDTLYMICFIPSLVIRCLPV